MTRGTDDIIQLENVWTTYEGADLPVIKDVTLEIKHGEFVVIGGPKRCGKNDLVRDHCRTASHR
jgi:ABC-type bacteriocin/lantibiotic exporters, contain an N-terminal double-glycine peptidase domain